MWDIFRLSAVGSFSLRRIALFFMAVMMSALFVATSFSTTTFAVDASWRGDAITYGEDSFTKQDLTLPGTEAGSQTYVSEDQSDTCPRPATVIVIPAGADTTKEVPNAKVVNYTIDCNDNYADPRDERTISIAAKAGGANGGDGDQGQTSCAVKGIGWIVCSTSRFMADSMDRVYGWISDFLTVKPLSTDTDSPLYKTWTIVRSLANACFIIAFLIIIYSQITSYGISNYEIKKMIPRLIIAAVLVNVSYYICAVAVDLSNILGDSIARSLSEIRNSLPSPMPQGSLFNSGGQGAIWATVTAFILSGGTIGAIGLTGATAGGSIAALATLLFPVLVLAILSVLVALLVLAARQALITVLVVLSPLAFVAFLLPNTEKQFDRWRGLFITMLMVFPMFSLLFGGSQLASYIIIQNTESISVVILALFVQAAPLALTPFLVKFSGSLLGKLAGMVNNPQKGLVDRSRNWAKDRADTMAKRKMALGENRRGYTPSGLAYRRSRNKQKRERTKKLYETQLEAAYANDRQLQSLATHTKATDLRKSAGDAVTERKFEHLKHTTPALQNMAGIKRIEEMRTKQLHAADEARWEEAATGLLSPNDPTQPYARFSKAANEIYKQQRIADSNASIAKALQSREYAVELGKDANVELQKLAGGNVDKLGAVKVKSNALSEVIKAGQENVGYIKTASHVKAGDIKSMRAEFDKAVANNDVDSLRAYADMLGESKDPGIRMLREALNKHHDAIKASDMHETFMHFLNSNGTINASAKDIGDYSRDVEGGYRKLSEISANVKTWKNMDSNQLATQKASSQMEALMAKDDDGNWAISRRAAVELMRSQSWENVKIEMKPLIRARAEGRLGFSIRDNKPIIFPMDRRDDTLNPPAQNIPDSLVPPE